RPEPAGEVGAEGGVQRAADQGGGVRPQEPAAVVTGVQHPLARRVGDEQDAVRLDAAGHVDRFAVALRQVRERRL
ncbi:MAG: hypothetical protein JWO31_2407, partial [Phycisphaerales bacterium]|nr:hypothetical protein [Phycisphaerales bacterium]